MTDGNILVSICCDHCYLGIKTYSRENGRHGRFLLRRELIEQLLSSEKTSEVIDTDINSFILVRLQNDIFTFQLYWLSEYREQELEGLRQVFYLSRHVVEDLLARDIVTDTYLCRPPSRFAEVNHAGAARTVQNALSDKRVKRALSKAMRDAFQWPGEQITLYNDGSCNFFFTTEKGFRISGGLILHEGKKNGYPCVYYSIHT